MKIWISGRNDETIACLSLEKDEKECLSIHCLEGELPKGLTVQDLSYLGIVTYEPDSRGRPVPKICPIEPSENLDYLRALIEAMPPGYFISKVESAKIDELRREKADKFEAEILKFEDDDS